MKAVSVEFEPRESKFPPRKTAGAAAKAAPAKPAAAPQIGFTVLDEGTGANPGDEDVVARPLIHIPERYACLRIGEDQDIRRLGAGADSALAASSPPSVEFNPPDAITRRQIPGVPRRRLCVEMTLDRCPLQVAEWERIGAVGCPQYQGSSEFRIVG